MVIVDRTSVLDGFNFQYTGTDDLILWLAADDYSHGIFHEPFFYGQNYNVMLEALIAVPLLKFGLAFKYALPISSAFLTLFPFFLFSIVLFKKKYTLPSFIILMLPLSLPVEYGIMTSMSRGFIQGLFFTSFFIFPLLSPYTKVSWFISALASGLAFVCNPNSVIVIFPFALFMFLNNYKNFLFYVIHVACLGFILWLSFLAKQFYIDHPDFNVHPLMTIEFSFEQLIENIFTPSKFFSFYTPFYWYVSWLIVPILFLVGVALFKSQKIKSVALILSVLFLILSLGVNKVNDGVDDLLLASSRMYLGIPILTGIAILWMNDWFASLNKYCLYGLFILCLVTFIVKQYRMLDDLKFNTRHLNVGAVAIQKISDIENMCQKIKMAADTNQVDFILFIPSWMINTAETQLYNCGCPLLIDKMPQTQLIMYEKRTWVFLAEKENVRKNILMFGMNPVENRHLNVANSQVIARFPDITLIKNNTQRLDSLLKDLGYTDYGR